MNILAIADIFGVELKQQIQLNVKAQKTIVGGLASLLILGTSFAYLVYIFNEWLNSRLLPKSSKNMIVDEFSTLNIESDENFFQFFYSQAQGKLIDPFRPNNNILIPLGMYFENGTLVETINFLNQEQNFSSLGTLKYGLNKMSLKQSFLANNLQSNVREFMLVFIKCNQFFLSQGQSCATEQEFSNFFESNSNFIQFQIQLKEFSQNTQKFETVTKSMYLTLDSKISTQAQIFIKQTYAYIDTGVIFESIQKESFIQEVQMLTQATQINIWRQALGEDCFLNIIFRLDPVSNEFHLVYPKLGEILAQVGSIANILLLLRYLVLFYNEKVLENYFIDQVLGFYFSNYKELRKSKVNINKDYCKNLIKQAQQKLVYINILYELSRIQLFLQDQFGRNKLIQSHKLGIKLPPIDSGKRDIGDGNSRESQRFMNSESENKFFVDDFFLLSSPEYLGQDINKANQDV